MHVAAVGFLRKMSSTKEDFISSTNQIHAFHEAATKATKVLQREPIWIIVVAVGLDG